MEWIGVIISVLGFAITYAGITRKLVTKEDLQVLVSQLNDISDRVVELEKKTSLLEYRIDKLENK